MKDMTLLVMAAGMGSRYGGLKQLDAVGPNGETIIDFSVYDAIRAGYNKVVFIIRKDFEKQFKQKLHSNFRNIIFNGSQSQKLPGLVSISFPKFRSDILIIKLDREKIYVSNGSACGSGLVKPSHVLEAIGLDESTNLSTLRFSFGISNDFEEIETLIHVMKNKILK